MHVLLLIALCLSLMSQPASARRFLVAMGNNVGDRDEPQLRFAENDAQRVVDTLTELGEVHPHDVAMLLGQDADTARSAILRMNERVREAGPHAVLILYYSGHADAQALHLGHTRLAFADVLSMAKGSPAQFRLVVVDACQSGAITQQKGIRAVHPLPASPPVPEGMAVLSSSSLGEAAAESDDIAGSFFTHALVSGLRGPADADGDGAVTVDEAFLHAEAETRFFSARTAAGEQHPRYRYEVAGSGSFKLTTLSMGDDRAALTLPEGTRWLLIKSEQQPSRIAAEVSAHTAMRTIWLRAGRYHVVGSDPSNLFEGDIDIRPGTSAALDVHTLQRSTHARLVRKGGRPLSLGVDFGLHARTPLFDREGACLGASASASVDFRYASTIATLDTCQANSHNATLTSKTRAAAVSASVLSQWDVWLLTVGAGAGLGAVVFEQTFVTRGVAPSRWSSAPFARIIAQATVPLPYGFFVSGDVTGDALLLQTQLGLRTPLAAATRVSLGVMF